MPDEKMLTQWEVDALLSAFAGEKSQESSRAQSTRFTSSRPVKNYDFRRPDKLSKEQMRSLTLLYENFARFLGTSLASFLRGAASIHLTSIEQITYSEYSDQLPKPSILFVLGLDPLPSRAVLEINVPIAFAIIDRLLGGPGETIPFTHNRQTGDLSEIEVTLLQTMTGHITAALHEAWSDVLTISPKVEDLAFNSELLQVALPNEICVLIILELKLLNSAGTMSLCIPYTMLEPIVGYLSAQALVAGSYKTVRRDDPVARQHALRQLEKVTLPVSVELGTTNVTIGDILHLEPGDTICLDSAANGPLSLLVDGRLRARVRPGVAGSHLAVQVEEILPPDLTSLEETAVASDDDENIKQALTNGGMSLVEPELEMEGIREQPIAN